MEVPTSRPFQPKNSSETSGYRRLLIEALELHLDALAEQIVDEIRREVPAYAIDDEATTENLRQNLARATRPLMRALHERTTFTDEELNTVEAVAAEPAAMGTPLEDVLSACWIGHLRTTRLLADLALELGQGQEIGQALAELCQEEGEYIRTLTVSITRGYMTGHERHMTARLRREAELVEEVLTGSLDSMQALAELALQSNRDLSVPQALVAVTAAHPVPLATLRRAVLAVAEVFPAHLEPLTHLHPSPHAIVVATLPPLGSRPSLVSQVEEIARREEMAVLLVDSPTGLAGLHEAHRDVESLIGVVARVATGRLSEPADLHVYRILAASPAEALDLVVRTLGPILSLPASRRRALLEVLDVLEECGGRPSAAARIMHLTDKAVRYRIGKIRDITGLDPFHPADRLRLDLARHALRLVDDEPESPTLPSHSTGGVGVLNRGRP